MGMNLQKKARAMIYIDVLFLIDCVRVRFLI